MFITIRFDSMLGSLDCESLLAAGRGEEVASSELGLVDSLGTRAARALRPSAALRLALCVHSAAQLSSAVAVASASAVASAPQCDPQMRARSVSLRRGNWHSLYVDAVVFMIYSL